MSMATTQARRSSLSPPPPPVSPPLTPNGLSPDEHSPLGGNQSEDGTEGRAGMAPASKHNASQIKRDVDLNSLSTDYSELDKFIQDHEKDMAREWWEHEDSLLQNVSKSLESSSQQTTTSSQSAAMSTLVTQTQDTERKPQITVTFNKDASSHARSLHKGASSCSDGPSQGAGPGSRLETLRGLEDHGYHNNQNLVGLQREMRVRLETLVNTVRTVGLKRGQEATVLDRIADISETYASTLRTWQKHEDELQQRNQQLVSHSKKQSLKIQELEKEVLDSRLRAERAENTLKMEQEDMKYQIKCKEQSLERQVERQRLQEQQWKSEIERQVQQRFKRRFNELKKKLASKYDKQVEETVDKLEKEFKSHLRARNIPEYDSS